MRERLLALISRTVVHRPLRVLTIAALAAVAGAALVPGLHVRAGHSAVVSSDSPDQRRFNQFLERFGSPNVLFALIEGGNAPLRRQLVDRLGARLPAPPLAAGAPRSPCSTAARERASGCVRDVFGRVALDRLERYGLLFLPQAALHRLVAALADPQLGFRGLAQVGDLSGLLGLAAQEVTRRAQLPAPTGAEAAEAGRALVLATQAIDALTESLRAAEPRALDLRAALAQLAGSAAQLQSGVDDAGYLRSRDGRMAVAMIRPIDESDEPAVVVPFVGYVQRQADGLAAALTAAHCGAEQARAGAASAACSEGPLRVRLAGLPALIVAEQSILDRDTVMTSAVAALAIVLIFVFGFRSLRQSLIGIVPLTIAMLCTLAAVRLTVGELNLITTAFIPTVLGIGIDFSVQLLARYNEARRGGAEAVAAVQTSIASAGPGVLTAALTMAGAFVALTACRFKGFADLGAISAMGLLIALASALFVGSAMLTWRPLRWLQRPPRLRHAPEHDPALALTRRVFSPLGRRLLLGGGVLVTVLMFWRGQSIPWSYNYLDLLPADAGAVQAVSALAEHTDFSFEVAALDTPSLAAARDRGERLARLATVGRVESLASYLPADQEAKRRELERLRPVVGALTITPYAPPSTGFALARWREGLDALLDALQDISFTAERAGQQEAARGLAPTVAALQRLREASATLPAERVQRRLAALEATVIGGLRAALSLVQQSVGLEALTEARLLELLPRAVRDRLHAKGHYALYVYPKGSLWAPGFLPRFVDDLRSVDRGATGFPVSHWESNLAIQSGFRSATALAGLAIVLLLAFDFRSVRYTALALFPLSVGIAWMWGSMSLLGMSYNFANIVGFPMIVGIGVAYGIYILHRFRQEGERNVPAVVRNTGLGVLLSALANMAGFGSIALATHRGARSLGLLLFFGCCFCLIAAALLLPALLGELKRERR
ncbi:MAG: MMPL family transporter [Proteobacteria bacterium]|nr:MMPL family transporter [Pseudomonadota bacterium]